MPGTDSQLLDLSIGRLRAAYTTGSLTPAMVIDRILQRADELVGHNIWIRRLQREEIEPYLDALGAKDPATTPLWGIPFAIKDNIDLAGIPTTAGCTAFAYTPAASATAVQKLLDAGAIPIGKTNLDQLATGLNGTRSPWGACRNAFQPDYISGGSSSGSAVAVARGLASFSLGTDTAGSGRVPAGFNNLVGLKPSRGLLSTTGVVPACRSLDCISIFALSADDANRVLAAAEGLDSADAYSRANPFDNMARHYGRAQGPLRLGTIPPAQLKFFGDQAYEAIYHKTLERLRADGNELVEIDYAPFDEAARLLYEGPWVTERYLAALPLVAENPGALLPVIREIIEPGGTIPATAVFQAQYRLQALQGRCRDALCGLDGLLTPTAGRLFTIEELLQEPVRRNSELGYYTNFVNLLDMAAVAVPAGFTAGGLPFGVTLVGPAFSDRWLLAMANRLQQLLPLPMGAVGRPQAAMDATAAQRQGSIDVAVCGAHLSGLPLNWQLTERGATLRRCTRTAPVYRMYALAGGPPLRPGLVRDNDHGRAIDAEIWSVPAQEFGSFVAGIRAPLGIGKVLLEDGSSVSGFICEPAGLAGAEDITVFGSWRAWLAGR